MTLLLFVRHGETDWTTERRLQGATDIDLNGTGLRDAARLRATVEAWHPVSAVVSPLSRARSTLAALSDLEPVVDERLAEASLGEWEGCVPAELGADYTRWRAGELVPPRGETLEVLRARVADAAHAAAALDGPVLVVTHGGVIRAALAHFVGLTADRLEPVAAPSLTVLDVPPAAGAGRLVRYNVTA